MKASEMRQFSAEELQARVTQWQENLFRSRCNQVIGQVTDSMQIRIMRRQIARAKTLIHEMQQNAAE